MITTTIRGGLGNQMFMYAAVRAMAMRNSTTMAFNLNLGFEDDKKLFQRELELTHFNLSLPESRLSTMDVPFAHYFVAISRRLGFNLLKPSMRFLCEKKGVDIRNSSVKDAYIEGFWGKEYYFSDYEDVIRNDFTIKQGHYSSDAVEELKMMRALSDNLVMVGVRRYQECTMSNQVPPGAEKADADYFRRTMKLASQSINDPVFCIFSQDQKWFKENVDDGSYRIYYVKEKKGPLSTIDDMYLMTHCDHYIISYSTYYWWAAWLGANPDKKVYCLDIDNYGCAGWIKI